MSKSVWGFVPGLFGKETINRIITYAHDVASIVGGCNGNKVAATGSAIDGTADIALGDGSVAC